MTPPPFEGRVTAGGTGAPDFGALVALLAAHQAAQPTARLATRLALGGARDGALLDSLVAVFAPRRLEPSAAAALRGRFNPAVPISDTPLTEEIPW